MGHAHAPLFSIQQLDYPVHRFVVDRGRSMQIIEGVLKKLPLSDAAQAVTTGGFDRFPPLVLDRCLETSTSTLVKSIAATYQAGTLAPTETLTMPRRGFGPRPVTVTSPATRTVYRALIQQVAGALAAPRTHTAWEEYESFGKAEASESPWDPVYYLVDLDIASCYEYVDHGILLDELVRRTMDVKHSGLIVELLTDIYSNRRGLPQLNSDSDLLADTYREIMERQLLRNYSATLRFADDFKVVSQDWGHANGVIEDGAEYARDLGLILSTEKTNITKSSTIAQRRQEDEDFMGRHFSEAKDALSIIDFFRGGYGFDAVEIPPGEEETVQEALRRILEDWYKAKGQDVPRHTQKLATALSVLATSDTRLTDDWLAEVVFRQPLRLENVVRYILGRAETAENWATLQRLTAMPRQSPWAKIWLLHAINELPTIETTSSTSVFEWIPRQLDDRHEVVRCEAAWSLACEHNISQEQLAALYRDASSITRPAIAACCGMAKLGTGSGVVKAVRADSPLSSESFKWGAALAEQ